MSFRLLLTILIFPLISSCVVLELTTPKDLNFTVGDNITFQGTTAKEIEEVQVVAPSGSVSNIKVDNKSFAFNLVFNEEINNGQLILKALKSGNIAAEAVYSINVRNGRPQISDDMSVFGFNTPSDSDLTKSHTLWATYYYLLVADAIDDGVALRNLQGDELGPEVSKKNWCLGALEGSILVWDNGVATTYNYAGTSNDYQVDCSPYFDHTPSHRVKFRLANNAFGDGVKNYPLIPYRTIAVDPRVIPYGSVVYIPEARGVDLTLPDGTKLKHDGYFFAGDTGGLIKNTHIDVFYGPNTKNPFDFVKSRESGTFKAYIVDPGHEAALFLENIH